MEETLVVPSAPSADLGVRVRFDGDGVVDLEIEARRAGPLIAAVAAAARSVRAVIQRLELRPRQERVGARIVLASDHAEGLTRCQRSALVAAVLAAVEGFMVPAPA